MLLFPLAGFPAVDFSPSTSNFGPLPPLFFFQAEDGIRDVERSRGLGDVYKRQGRRKLNRREPSQGKEQHKLMETRKAGEANKREGS